MINKFSFYTWILLICWAFLISLTVEIPNRLEGLLFPVAENFEISNSVPYDNGIRFFGTFDKIRNCDFETITAYNSNRTSSTRILVRFDDPSTIRPPGSENYGPWYTPTENLENLELYVYHRCHPFWLTKTRLK